LFVEVYQLEDAAAHGQVRQVPKPVIHIQILSLQCCLVLLQSRTAHTCARLSALAGAASLRRFNASILSCNGSDESEAENLNRKNHQENLPD